MSFRWGNHTFTGHNSPLYSRPDETSESSPGYQLSTDFAIKYWLSLGTVVKSFLLILKKVLLTKKWYFVTKIVMTYCEKKNCSSDREKLLKFEAEGQELAKFLRSLEQFIQTVKGLNNFLVTERFFNFFLEVSLI